MPRRTSCLSIGKLVGWSVWWWCLMIHQPCYFRRHRRNEIICTTKFLGSWKIYISYLLVIRHIQNSLRENLRVAWGLAGAVMEMDRAVGTLDWRSVKLTEKVTLTDKLTQTNWQIHKQSTVDHYTISFFFFQYRSSHVLFLGLPKMTNLTIRQSI